MVIILDDIPYLFLMILIGSILTGAFSDKSNLTMVDVALLNQSEGMAAEVIDALTTASVSIEKKITG
ncbi:hypothetical protein ACFTAO_15615 [Paenibacillus rhizoplanae]